MTGKRAERIKPERQITAGFLGPGVHFTGYVVDLSETGVLVHCAQEIQPNTIGRLGIDVGSDVLRTIAVVRRKVPGIGLAFEISHMSPRNRDLLHRLLFRLGWHATW